MTEKEARCQTARADGVWLSAETGVFTQKHAPILKLTILFTSNLGYTIRVIKRLERERRADKHSG